VYAVYLANYGCLIYMSGRLSCAFGGKYVYCCLVERLSRSQFHLPNRLLHVHACSRSLKLARVDPFANTNGNPF
jgi:hypothetical protein